MSPPDSPGGPAGRAGGRRGGGPRPFTATGGAAARTTARELARQRHAFAVRHVAARCAVYLLAAAAALAGAAPFLWGLATAFQAGDGGGGGWRAVVRHARYLFGSTPFPGLAARTALVGAAVAALTLLPAVPAAYALARLRRRHGRAGAAVLVVYALPPVLLVPPLARAVAAAGARGATWPLVVVYPSITIPVAVWLLAGLLRAVPADVEEQALVDGHGRLAAFARVVVPTMAPGAVAVAVLAFTLAAGEFTYARAFAAPGPGATLSAALPGLTHGDALRPVQLGVVIVAVPLGAVVNIVLDRLVAALAGSADRT